MGSAASLIVFLTLFFLSIWMAWVLAVRLTAPKVAATELPAGAKAKILATLQRALSKAG
jgi:hypothetical protein